MFSLQRNQNINKCAHCIVVDRESLIKTNNSTELAQTNLTLADLPPASLGNRLQKTKNRHELGNMKNVHTHVHAYILVDILATFLVTFQTIIYHVKFIGAEHENCLVAERFESLTSQKASDCYSIV